MDIDFENLALAQQVLDRQRRHAEAANDHLERYACLDAAETGLDPSAPAPLARMWSL